VEDGVEGFWATNLNLAVCPSRNFDYNVDDGWLAGIRIKRDVVPE
jgi:hypothetical protein